MVMDRQIVEPGEMSLHSEKVMPVQSEPQVTAENNEFVCLTSHSVPVNLEKTSYISNRNSFISKNSAMFKLAEKGGEEKLD